MIKIEREAKKRILVDIVTTEDPESANVFFAFPARGERPSTFVAGTWNGTATTSEGVYIREAITPRIGDVSLDLAAGHYRFYGKVTLGLDEDVWEIDPEGLEVV